MRMSQDRGRPRGVYHKSAYTALEYIDRISIKHNIDLNIFFKSLVEAGQFHSSKCGSLLIECREKKREYSIFLITKDSNVVAQFHIPNYILQEKDPLKNFVSSKSLRQKIMAKDNIEDSLIRDLKVGMKRINLIGKITEISKLNTVFNRLGKANRVANAKLNDGTGFIQMPLWNQQIKNVASGDEIKIENASVVSFRGKLQLRLNRGSQVKVIKKTKPLQKKDFKK